MRVRFIEETNQKFTKDKVYDIITSTRIVDHIADNLFLYNIRNDKGECLNVYSYYFEEVKEKEKTNSVILEHLDAYSRLSGDCSSSQSTGVVRIKQGKSFIYLTPVGVDWECDGGHYIDELSEEEFNKQYTLTKRG